MLTPASRSGELHCNSNLSLDRSLDAIAESGSADSGTTCAFCKASYISILTRRNRALERDRVPRELPSGNLKDCK